MIYLFNGKSTPYGLLNAEIWFICKCLIVIITIFSIFNCIFKNIILSYILIDWLINFNNISTWIGLFYAEKLGNHWKFIIISLCSCFLKDFAFAHGPFGYKWFLIRSIWPIDGTLTGTTTPGQSVPVRNGGVHHTPQFPKIDPHQQMQFSVICRTGFFGREPYPSAVNTVEIF